MSRTKRNKRPRFKLGESLEHMKNKDGSVRDGTPTHSSGSCQHGGDCPLCKGNRTFSSKKREPLIID